MTITMIQAPVRMQLRYVGAPQPKLAPKLSNLQIFCAKTRFWGDEKSTPTVPGTIGRSGDA